MLDSSLIPFRLVDPKTERTQIRIVQLKPPSRFRVMFVSFDLLKTLVGIGWLRVIRALTGQVAGERVREFLQRSGTLWVRTGRILALRTDLFSFEFCEELERIQDWADGFPFDMARQIVEEELGAPMERYFSEFHEEPFASTTFSQIHMARLRRENVMVAVNIQRPYVHEVFRQDKNFINWIAGMITRFPSLRKLRAENLCQEPEQIVERELDYRYEASTAHRLKKTLNEHGVYIYSVYHEYSSHRVLVTEFIKGALMIDYVRIDEEDPERLRRWLQNNNINPKKLAKRLFESVFRQIFEDNYFHGDMRLGNVVLLRNSQFSVLDTRSVSSTESESLEKYRLFLNALVNEEFEIAADIFFLMTSVMPRVDTVEVKKEILRLWKTWTLHCYIHELPYNEKSLTHMFAELNKIVLRHRFAIQWSALYMVRTLANMEVVINHLAPETNCISAIKRYFDKAKARESRASLRNAQITSIRLLAKVREMPQRLTGYLLFQDIVLRRQTRIISGTTAKAGYVLGSLAGIASMAFFMTGVVLLCAFLVQGFVDFEPNAPDMINRNLQPIRAMDHILGTQIVDHGVLYLAGDLLGFMEAWRSVWSWLIGWFAILGSTFFGLLFNIRMARRFLAKDVQVSQSGVRL